MYTTVSVVKHRAPIEFGEVSVAQTVSLCQRLLKCKKQRLRISVAHITGEKKRFSQTVSIYHLAFNQQMTGPDTTLVVLLNIVWYSSSIISSFLIRILEV